MYRHSLIIGGTGMLEKATRTIIGQSECSTLVARHASGFLSGAHPVNANYTDTNAFLETVRIHLDNKPSVDLAVIWMHRTGNETLKQLLPILNKSPVLIDHLLGSANGDPRTSNPVLPAIQSLQNITYAPVILGRMGNRWLTHNEISDGTLGAIGSRQATIIGEF